MIENIESDRFEEAIIALAVDVLTKRQIEVLKLLAKGKDLVREGRTAYIGLTITSAVTVNALLRVCAIRLEDGCEVGRLERYQINGTGKKILERISS